MAIARNYLHLLLALFLSACLPLLSSTSNIKSAEINVKTDVLTLQNRINLPKNVSSVQWVVLPRGVANSNVPGPTDTILYAVLKANNNNWSALPQAKVSLNEQETVKIPIQVAKKLFSADIIKGFTLAEGYLEITGKQYDPNFFNKSGYLGIYAIVVHDNLLICLQST